MTPFIKGISQNTDGANNSMLNNNEVIQPPFEFEMVYIFF